MESTQKETHAASATMRVNVESQRGGPLLLQKRRRKAKKTVRREDHSRASVRSGRGIEDRAKITWMEIARTPRVILGILPCVRVTAGSLKKCLFLKKEADHQLNKRPKKGVRKGSVGQSKNAMLLNCVFQEIDPPKFNSILRKGTKS